MSKVWFVTGSSKGFGREFVLAALECGDRVAATARNIDTLSDLVEKYGDSVLASVGLLLANRGLPLGVAIPLVLVGVFLEAGFTPAALSHLSDISAEYRDNRGLIMGAYSVVVGAGYLLGNILGGVFAEWRLFEGLAILTMLLAAIALISIAVMYVIERRMTAQRVTV